MALTSAAVAGISLAITAISTGVSIYSSMAQGRAQAAAATAQAQQALMQSQQQALEARQSRIQGEVAELNARGEAAAIQREALQLQGRQVAQAAGAGAELNSGSFMAIVADSAKRADEDRLQVLRTGAMQRASYDISSAAQEAGAVGSSMASSAARKSASSAKTQGLLNAGTSFFQGASSSLKIGKDAGWFD